MDAYTSEPHYQRRPLAGLVAELWRESSTLLRNEAALAKVEFSEKVSDVGNGLASLAIGGAVLFAGLLFVLLAIVGGVAQVLPEEHASWLAPLLVGGVVLMAGWLLLSAGRNKIKSESMKPSRMMRSVQRDAEVLKEHMK
jgi:uncharacterized membrane protein YgdD (TMEM256/DUF423 family)